ncbi:MAG: hypothetical protein N2Z59_07585, partial [Alteraurantiacibacter sp.]|nr:hypothetical protein [Alteraurantiacibacter sp.]
MPMTRRDFSRLGALSLGAALAAQAGVARAAEGAGLWDISGLSVAERLRPIAPELRPAARRMIESGFPPITEEVLRQIAQGAPAAPPSPDLLPNIPVYEQRVAGVGALPEVPVFVINSEPTLSRPAILHIHGGG